MRKLGREKLLPLVAIFGAASSCKACAYSLHFETPPQRRITGFLQRGECGWKSDSGGVRSWTLAAGNDCARVVQHHAFGFGAAAVQSQETLHR
jgi:hypothetical protein